MVNPVELDRKCIVLRRQGVQSAFDVAALGEEMTRLSQDEAAQRFLLDWSSIECWPFEAPSAAALKRWNNFAPRFRRVAIVHAPKWNQHAALLSALLRVANTEVRSFHPRDHRDATVWLNQD